MSIESQIRDTALKYNVPPDLALAVATAESGLDPNARGSSGEIGLFQLMPATADWLGVDPFDTDQNIEGGVQYLSQQYSTFGSWDSALAAYNAGPGRVSSGNIPSSTVGYVDNVLGLYQGYIEDVGMMESPTFSTTVFGTPLDATGFPMWVLAIGAGALLSILLRRRKQ